MNLFCAGFEFQWYGFLIGAAMLICIIAAYFLLKKAGYYPDIVFTVALVSIPCAIIGARLYYIIFDIAGGANSFAYWFKNSDGKFTLMPFIGYPGGKLDGFPQLAGLALYGGLIAAALGGLIVRAFNKREKNPRNKMTYIQMLDAFFILIILGQVIGRWGNYANGEAYGRYVGQESWFPYAVYIKNPKNAGEIPGYYQATFFYESILNLIGFGIMLWMWLGKRKSFDGLIFSFYCVWYGFVRLLIEGLRGDSLYSSGGFNTFLFVTLLLVGVGLFAGFTLREYLSSRKKGEKLQIKNLLMVSGTLLFAALCVLFGAVGLIAAGKLRISQLVSGLLIAYGASTVAGHIIKAKVSGKNIFIFTEKSKLNLDYCDYDKSIIYICETYDKNGQKKSEIESEKALENLTAKPPKE